MEVAMKWSRLLVFTVLVTLAGARTLQAGTNKAADSSALATAPTYDQTGVIENGHYGDTASFTDAHGNTTSVTCVGTDCSESNGISENGSHFRIRQDCILRQAIPA
jgi:hypothetical protein